MKILLFVVFVAPAVFAQSPVSDVKAACGPEKAEFQTESDQRPRPEPQPIADKALVYVIQDSGQAQPHPAPQVGKGPALRIGMDGRWMGATHARSYFFFYVEPGEHHLCVGVQSRLAGGDFSALSILTAESGKVYYFRQRELSDGLIRTFDLDEINGDQGKLLLSYSKRDVLQPKH
jgi:Protein of unknown function (DUF2846)